MLVAPGGGGYGDPKERPIHLVENDVREGFISPTTATSEYGLSEGELRKLQDELKGLE
ncbi:MAG: hypothetical protein ACE5PO_02665 [Candidatus Bathyarchaeia archaeon]